MAGWHALCAAEGRDWACDWYSTPVADSGRAARCVSILMRVAEIFRSLQGEGFLTGTPSVFVRASGCNLRCWYCDTPYTSWEPEGDDWSVDEILRRVDALTDSMAKGGNWQAADGQQPAACRHAVLTGGEPMLFAELVPLAAALRERGFHITIETAGTLYLPLACDLMSISPKLAGSTPPAARDERWHQRHERNRHVPDVIRRLTREYDYQIKFVVDSPRDCQEAEAWLGEFPEIDRARVLFMPQGIDQNALREKARWLEPYCQEHGFTFCPRKHIEWFGNARGT
jgi:7-carboxy-7-deazaguanine synthase